MRTLTPELLRERTSRLFDDVLSAHGPVEEVLWEIVRCDGCGRVHNRLIAGDPHGWTCSGSFDEGWVDHCPACS